MPGRDVIVPPRTSRLSHVQADKARPRKTGSGLVMDSVVGYNGRQNTLLHTAKPHMPAHSVAPSVADQPITAATNIPRVRVDDPLSKASSLKQKRSRRNNKKRRISLALRPLLRGRTLRYALILAIVVATTYVGVDIWSVNSQLKQDLDKTVNALGSPNAKTHQDNEGRDETPVPEDVVDTYQVAASLPKVITIADAKVRARVLLMDVNPDNSIQAPINIYDAGWYTGSAKPGEPGAALIDAHASGATRAGLFAYLDELKAGDTIEVERGDGKKFIYETVHTEVVRREEVDMKKLLVPYGDEPQGLNLITCAGVYMKDEATYDHRVVVYSKLVNQVIQ